MKKQSGKKNILVIDDEEGIRAMLETRLFKCGFLVDTAATGLQAIQKMRSGNHYDLIICDLKMPGMSGAEVFKEMKNLCKNDPAFLLMTGYPEKEKLMGAMKTGIANVLIKPIRFVTLMEKIEMLLGPMEMASGEKAAA